MGAIHELREEYRFFQSQNPQFRWLFLLLDLTSLLIKLALFGGFLFFCWYLISRSPYAEQTDLFGKREATRQADEVVAESVPELSEERLARLREIAGRDGDSPQGAAALVGKVADQTDQELRLSEESTNKSAKKSDTLTVATFDKPSATPEVKVASVTASDKDRPLVPNKVDSQVDSHTGPVFTENVYIPEDIESGSWVLKQNSGDYTIQLALTVNVEFLVDFAAKLPGEYTAAIYPERVNSSDKIQYSLSLGSFPSWRSAEAALAELDENLKRYGAHTRVFGEAQKNISGFVL